MKDLNLPPDVTIETVFINDGEMFVKVKTDRPIYHVLINIENSEGKHRGADIWMTSTPMELDIAKYLLTNKYRRVEIGFWQGIKERMRKFFYPEDYREI